MSNIRKKEEGSEGEKGERRKEGEKRREGRRKEGMEGGREE